MTSLAGGITTQRSVIGAMILREFAARFSRENLGFIWVILEPMMLASVIVSIHLIEPSHMGSGVQPAAFAMIGYVIFIIFRGVVTRSDQLVDVNASLMYHRPVKLLDIILARSVVETFACVCTLTILMSLCIATGLAEPPARPLQLFSAILLMIWWSISVSMIVAAWTYKNETIGRQVHVFCYFCIPLSGAFWQLGLTPLNIRNVLQWFPMTLIFEQARYGQFEQLPSTYVQPAYVSAVCAVLTLLGLSSLRWRESHL